MPEIKRKLVRMTVLIFPVLYLFFSKSFLFYLLGLLSFVFLILEILRFRFPELTQKYFQYLPWFAKEREKMKISGTTWLIWGIFLTVLLFERNIALLAVLFLIIGDAVAALVRQKTEKIKVFNRGLEGSLGTLIICLVIGYTLGKFWQISLIAVALGAISATLVELIPLRIKNFYIDDNFSIALVSGFVMSIIS